MPLADRNPALRKIDGLPNWARAIALVALVALVYWPILANGYVSDDEIYIRGIRDLASLGGLRDIWLRIGAIPQYYPLVHTAFWFEHRLWGLDPVGFHAMNLATHAGVVLLLWRLLVTLRIPGAWFAAALFAVHPVHVETVAWASERKNLFSAAFALASMHAYLRFAPLDPPSAAVAASMPTSRRSYLASLALYVAALLCKTVTVTTPAALLVLRWWRSGRLQWRDVRPLLPFFALGLPIAALTVWIERVHVGATGAAWNLSPLERVLIAGRAVWFYIGKLLWPHPLGFTYPRWNVDSHAAWQYGFPLALAGSFAVLWAVRRQIGRGPLAALLLFVGVLFPALGFFDVYPFLYSFVADHYQYHASMALFALAAAGATMTRARWPTSGRWLARVAAIGVVAVLAVLAHRETYAYRDEVTLIRHNAAQRPDSWTARYRLGLVLQNERRNAEAIAEFQEALRLHPAFARLHTSIGINLAALGRLDEAAAHFETALAGDLDDEERATTQLQLGNLRVTQNRFDDAAAAFRAGAALTPGAAELHYNLGIVLRQTGDRAGAIAALRDAVASDATIAKSQFALGKLLSESGDVAGALEPLRRAVQLAPEQLAYRHGLAAALLLSGDPDSAEGQLRAIVAGDPRNADAYNLLGVVFEKRGDRAAAIAAFEQALQIDPRHPGAAANLQRTHETEPQR
jgi:protein O-mannosyl-transferase